MPITITELAVLDVRFPTSDSLDGSDAMNRTPDYSAAYVDPARTDRPTGSRATASRSPSAAATSCASRAVESLAPLVVGRTLDVDRRDFAAFWYELVGDGQLRWLGPEKGVIHLATAAVVNAVWDLHAKVEGKPLWKLLADMTPEADRPLHRLPLHHRRAHAATRRSTSCGRQAPTQRRARGRAARDGYPAYTTSAGWLGYADDKVRRLCREGVADGWTPLQDQGRRATSPTTSAASAIVREEIGAGPHPDDRRQPGVGRRRGDRVDARARAGSTRWWIEEPTSPDDVLGHAPIARALAPPGSASPPASTAHNRVIFKQLLQAEAIGFCQIDSCRLGGVNEVLAVLLLAAKFGVPVCPHAGGVGLCEYVQHLAMFDYIARQRLARRTGSSSTSITCTSTSSIRSSSATVATSRRRRRATASRCGRSRCERFAFPDGEAWASPAPRLEVRRDERPARRTRSA